jgi:hypothetical protein
MTLTAFIQEHAQWIVCGLIAIGGLVIYGFRDLLRFSATRVWAISSVCFQESVRRKIWLIALLAVIGVFIVSQLQRPLDERDAIRQTTKFCLFATGLVVTITAIILACTNLPREIENRVIYTVVTKPTTRMEIVFGKILGFARISALILLIMGLFTFGYLHFRAWQFNRDITERLAMKNEVDQIARPTLEYYKEAGLLTARVMANSDDMQIYGRAPDLKSAKRYMIGAGEGDMLAPFEVKPIDLVPVGATPQQFPPGASGLRLHIRLGADRIPGYVDPQAKSALPPTVAAPASSQPTVKPPYILVQIFDANQNLLIPSRELNSGKPIEIDPKGQQETLVVIPETPAQTLYKPGSDLDKPIKFYVQVAAASDGYEFWSQDKPVSIEVPYAPGNQPRFIAGAIDPSTNKPQGPIFRGREGTAGQQVRGGDPKTAPIAVFRFNGAVPEAGAKDVAFEFKTGIERSGAESDSDESFTTMAVSALNRDTGKESAPIDIALESNRQTFFTLPADLLVSGNFDIHIRCKSVGHYLGVFPTSLGMVQAQQGFDFNLFKSLLIMWLMAILVITVAIFTSTFLSWPTAIVLTLVILLGRWGVEQLGDATQPGIGNMIAQDMGFTDPNKAKVVSSVAEALAGGLNMLSKVLPDISQFAATEDIERGLVVPTNKLGAALEILLCYGLATIALAYVRLTWVEVAP